MKTNILFSIPVFDFCVFGFISKSSSMAFIPCTTKTTKFDTVENIRDTQ